MRRQTILSQSPALKRDILWTCTDTSPPFDRFGLYAAVFSKNIDRCLRVGKALSSGSVGVNCTGPTVAFDMPFGGT